MTAVFRQPLPRRHARACPGHDEIDRNELRKFAIRSRRQIFSSGAILLPFVTLQAVDLSRQMQSIRPMEA